MPELLLALLDALELVVELDGLFSSFIPEELAAVLDEDATDELLVLLEPLATLELLEVEPLAKLLPELDGNSGASGIPAQEVRIMADITAAAAAPHTARKIGIFSFIWMHFLLHKYPLVKRLRCLVSVYSFRHGVVNEEKQQWGILFLPNFPFL